MAVKAESPRRPQIATRLVVLLVRGYQRAISPLLPATCRYVPSCSEYAVQALAQHGLLLGLWYAAARIVRCHPWAQGGDDPVPAARVRRGAHCP
jgi:putative membrane protein insertion efficiency factor